MKTKPEYWYNQSAVVPYKFENGKLKILLITSRTKKNWIIPKGIIEFGYSPQRSAEKEAFEEAGVLGEISDISLGYYKVKKWGGKCNVDVFPLKVIEELDKWEEDFRERCWVDLNEIDNYVKKKKLTAIVKQLALVLNLK